jgi:hypothetical protein
MWRIALLTTLFSTLAFAQIESVMKFTGQNAETITIEKQISYVRQLPYQVPSTCTRQVPYESYECRDVTRYRNECTWVPENQECWDRPEHQCRSVTRSRQECHAGPSRQVCHFLSAEMLKDQFA